MNKKVEILSPAGSYESLKAAIAAGADAVYIGGTRFGARAFADNLSEDKLLEVIDYVHLHGRKIYLTINTLLKENELKNDLYDYLLPYYKQGLDAVIVQDIGVLHYVKKHFPDLPIHASTQMTITDLYGAKFIEKQGVERVVTSREMNIREIREIAENTNLEIESFVHGALCYCYSGQCLYSSLIGGRSGNRGQCAQPCRLPYKVEGAKKEQYILSLKDICTLEYIPELVEAGICSFKIEGRMKKPEYVALVTAMYRKYLDLYFKNGKKGYFVEPKDKEKLLDLYNRGGSHGGYYHTNNGREMVSIDRPNHAGVPVLKVSRQNGKVVTAKVISNISSGDVIELPDGKENYTFAQAARVGQTVSFTMHKKQELKNGSILMRTRNEALIKEIQESIIGKKVKEKINGSLVLGIHVPSKLKLTYGQVEVEVLGECAQEALNQPIDAQRVERQLRKTGNTEFEFEQLDIEMIGNLFVPMQSLNELRRQGLEKLESKILETYRRDSQNPKSSMDIECEKRKSISGFYVYVEEAEQFEEVVFRNCVKRIYVDANAMSHIWDNEEAEEWISLAHDNEKEIYLAMPHIFRSKTRMVFEKYYDGFMKQHWDGVLLRNYEEYEFLKNHNYLGNIVTDYSLYHFNRYARAFWENEGVEAFTAPLELNYKELHELGMQNGELVVYGHFPMMISAQCITNTLHGCKKQKGRVSFKDRFHKKFTGKNCCDYCYNIIYNTAPVVLADQMQEVKELNPKGLRLHFTLEDRTRVKEILDLYEDVFLNGIEGKEIDGEFTRGHFKRGIK